MSKKSSWAMNKNKCRRWDGKYVDAGEKVKREEMEQKENIMDSISFLLSSLGFSFKTHFLPSNFTKSALKLGHMTIHIWHLGETLIKKISKHLIFLVTKFSTY